MRASVAVTWWGHATTTLELGGVRVLTDPLFARRLAHLRRIVPLPPLDDALRCDLVVVSHLHGDHLHPASLGRLADGTRVVGPHGTAALLGARARALDVVEVVPGEEVVVGDVRVAAVPAHHDGRRHSFSRRRGEAVGYVLSAPGATTWFAGDTGLFDAMDDLGPVDVAVVPIGGWGPSLGPEHLDPVQAVEAAGRVGAAHAVPVHHGTLWPTGLRRAHPASWRTYVEEPPGRFLAAATAAGLDARVPAVGGTVKFGPADPPAAGPA